MATWLRERDGRTTEGRQIWPESGQKPMTTQIEANAFSYQSLAGIEPEKSIPAGLF